MRKPSCAGLRGVIGRHTPPISEPQDVVLYGFGRIAVSRPAYS